MRTSDIIWFAIIALGGYAVFANNQWLGFIVFPLILGSFVIITGKQQVDDGNVFYRRWSKRVPFLFPPSFAEKTSAKAQHWITTLVGALAILFGVFNLLVMMNIIK